MIEVHCVQFMPHLKRLEICGERSRHVLKKVLLEVAPTSIDWENVGGESWLFLC